MMTAADSTSHGSPLRTGFLVIGRKRAGFDPEWGREMATAAWEALGQMKLEAVRPTMPVVDERSLRSALDELEKAGCDCLVVLQPTMGDGRLASVLAQLWDGPPVFWATPERPDSPKVSSCSLVGAHSFASIFRRLGRPFEIAYGHPDEPATRRQVSTALRLAAAVVRLHRAKLGLVGQAAPGFLSMEVDPLQLGRNLGVHLLQFGLPEFFDLVEAQDDQAVEDDVARVVDLGLPFAEGVGQSDLATNSRYYLAMRALLSGEELDALAVRCWPELPNRFGQWPYLAMARLADEGEIAALEGDVDGAVCCLIGRLLGAGVGSISDWLEHDEQTITLWHPGHAPLSLCEPGTARLGRHFNTNTPLVVDVRLAAERPITVFRLWHCDGAYRLAARNARTVVPRREFAGTNGLAVLDDGNVPAWFEALCHEGMPHHVTLLPGHHADTLKRLARLLQISWVAGL